MTGGAMAWWPWLGAAVVLSCGPAPAQDPTFGELRRWTWRSPEVLCAANDAAGSVVVYAIAAEHGDGWQLVLYDPQARRETGRLALAWRPMELRCREPGHVDVCVRDSDKLLSWSHWRRVRTSDGAEVGERRPYRLVEKDTIATARMAARAGPDADTCVYRRADRGIAWSQARVEHAITDATVRGLALTPDGQFVVLWLSSRILALPVAGGEPRTLPGRSEEIQAVVGGVRGDDVVVITGDGVQQWRCGDVAKVRAVVCRAGSVSDAALQPGGHLLAVTGANDVMLVDLVNGTMQPLQRSASRLAWVDDGRTLVCAGVGRFAWLDVSGADADVTLLAEVEQHSARKILGDWSLLALDAETVVWTPAYGSRLVRRSASNPEAMFPALPRLVARLARSEFLTIDGNRLGLCEGPELQPRGAVDGGGRIDLVATCAGRRRVAAIVGGEVIVFEVPALR